MELENYWFHQDRVVLKLAGYDTIETASAVCGISNSLFPKPSGSNLTEGQFYDWELEGCVVETSEGDADR